MKHPRHEARPGRTASSKPVRTFNPRAPLPPEVARFRADLITAYGQDKSQFKRLRLENRNEFSPVLEEKLKARANLGKLMEVIGGDPVVPWFAMKEQLVGAEKFTEFLDLLFIHFNLIGIKINQGGGNGGMALVAERYRAAEKLVRKYPHLKPIWKPGVISTSLLIAEEPLNNLHDPGWHVGPWRGLSNRTDCLMGGLGFIPAIGALPVGDSGLQEVYSALCGGKPSQRDNLDAAFSGYSFAPPVLFIDDDRSRFWQPFFDLQDRMISCRVNDSGSRKKGESRERLSNWLMLNGDILRIARDAYNIVDVNCQRQYGGSPADEWLNKNRLQLRLATIAERVSRGEPLD